MKSQSLALIAALGLIGWTVACHYESEPAASQTNSGDNGSEIEWQTVPGVEPPALLALDSVRGRPDPELRFLFVLVEGKHFNEEDLRSLFTGLAARYPEPETLDITAYSDKSQLARAVFNYLHYSPGLPLEDRTGYFAAKYLRREGDEHFFYTPDPNSESNVMVVIKKRKVEYTGDTTKDLLIATEAGDEGKVQSLLEQGADANVRDARGYPALTLAVAGRFSAIAEMLLRAGADANGKLGTGTTALHFAASSGQADIARMLIAYGADVNAKENKENNEESPLSIATYNDRGWEVTLLGLAAYNNRKELVSTLLQNGADPNIRDREGNTPLVNAAINGNVEFAQLLLSKGAAVNSKNLAGQTALMLACDEPQTLRLLLDNGAAVNDRDNDGWTALMFGAKEGRLFKVKALLAAGAQVNAKTKDGATALSVARRVPDNAEVIQALKNAGGRADDRK